MQRYPSLDQVAASDPHRADNSNDRITRQWLGIYENGKAGYALVYDRQDWRVYRRITAVQMAGEPRLLPVEP